MDNDLINGMAAELRESAPQVVFEGDGVSIAAVERVRLPQQATRQAGAQHLPQKDLLVLGRDGGLRLHVGASLAFRVSVPAPEPAASDNPSDGLATPVRSTPAG